MKTRRLGFPARRGRSVSTIERASSNVRKILAPDLKPDRPLDGVALFENLDSYYVEEGGRKIPIDYDIRRLAHGMEALTQFDPASGSIKVVLDDATYAALDLGDPRARFTICHEIGHVALHWRELVAMIEIPHYAASLARGDATHEVYEDAEWQADTFAQRLLVPTKGLLLMQEQLGRAARPMDVVHRFGISQQAAEHRIRLYKKENKADR